MPSTNQGSPSRDRRTFPSLREDIGEDPARWLDWEIVSNEDRKRMLVGLIRGMDRLDRLRAWKAVERRLGRGRDGGPRRWVIDRLDEREATLEEIGERPDRLPFGPRRPPEMLDTESNAVRRGDSGRSALDKVSSGRLATDGGEADAE